MQLKNDLPAVCIPFIIAILLGLFNGLIVTQFNVNSIIVTLGSLSVFAGLALFYVNGAIIIGRPDTWYSFIGHGKLLGVPLHVVLFIIVAFIYEIILSKTSFGRSLKYVGTNIEAARIAGVRVNRVRIVAFIISSLSVALAAVILSSRMNSGSPVAGVGFEFNAVTAVVIGGTSLVGGKGSIAKTVIGVLLLSVIINALTIYNVPYAFQNISKGLLIIIAIVIDVRSRTKYGK
jgi:ribose/xylose/arabinose/galactoside ABC-type transport system permease subunit